MNSQEKNLSTTYSAASTDNPTASPETFNCDDAKKGYCLDGNTQHALTAQMP